MVKFRCGFWEKAFSGKSSHVGIFGLFVPSTYILNLITKFACFIIFIFHLIQMVRKGKYALRGVG